MIGTINSKIFANNLIISILQILSEKKQKLLPKKVVMQLGTIVSVLVVTASHETQ